jgi:hypothetical protein
MGKSTIAPDVVMAGMETGPKMERADAEDLLSDEVGNQQNDDKGGRQGVQIAILAHTKRLSQAAGNQAGIRLRFCTGIFAFILLFR